jgi:hypothetical protein
MHIDRSSFGIACRAAVFSFLVAGTSSLLHAQQSTSVQPMAKTPFLLAAATSPAGSASAYSSSSDSSSSSVDAASSPDASADRFDLSSAAFGGSQPPPRRRYGRPNYSGGNSNADGSNKFAFMAGGGAGVAVGNTHRYNTEGYAFQVGAGRNWSKSFGVLAQFDYDHFGLQGATIANQGYIYNFCTAADAADPAIQPPCTEGPATSGNATPIDGNNHVWSFTLNPTFTLATEGSLGAYAVVGGGYYHKVTNFTTPTVQEVCYYYCSEAEVNANFDHYTSNAGGVNGGFGLTYKFSHFSNERFYLEARYVVIFDSQRYGVTTANVANSSLTATDLYPANSNRTTYIPVTVGLRF